MSNRKRVVEEVRSFLTGNIVEERKCDHIIGYDVEDNPIEPSSWFARFHYASASTRPEVTFDFCPKCGTKL